MSVRQSPEFALPFLWGHATSGFLIMVLISTVRGALLALLPVGLAAFCSKRKLFLTMFGVVIVAWGWTYLSDSFLMEMLDAFSVKGAILIVPLLSLVSFFSTFVLLMEPTTWLSICGGPVYFLLLTRMFKKNESRLVIHLLLGLVAGCMSYLVLNLTDPPEPGRSHFLFPGQFWGLLVGFGVWKLQQSKANKQAP